MSDAQRRDAYATEAQRRVSAMPHHQRQQIERGAARVASSTRRLVAFGR